MPEELDEQRFCFLILNAFFARYFCVQVLQDVSKLNEERLLELLDTAVNLLRRVFKLLALFI